MELSILTICYLIGSLTFIVGLKMLSHPESAREGNMVAAVGMFIAIFGTIFLYQENGVGLHNFEWIFGRGAWYTKRGRWFCSYRPHVRNV